MRLVLDATHEEVRDKGAALAKALTQAIGGANPRLAALLEKAAIPDEPLLSHHKVIRELHEHQQAYFDHAMARMMARVDAALQAQVGKTPTPEQE